MNAQQNKDVVKEAYRLYQNGDIHGVLAHCHDDAEWTSPESDFIPFAGSFRGKPGIADFFSKLDEAMLTTRFEPTEFIAEGDKVVVIGQASWMAKPTGQSFDSPWVHVFTMREGKVARFESFSDSAAGERAFRAEQGVPAPSSTQLHH